MSIEPERQGRQRKELAAALKQLRLASGLSGERLGARCLMSQTKISRIETGAVLPSLTDVTRILAALEVPDEVAEELLHLTRTANVDYVSWRTYARVGLWQQQSELKALAESSRTIRQFLPAMPSGLLQTPEYATLALSPTVASSPARDVAKAVQARMERQAVLDDPNRHFTFLLTEQAVRWRYGSAGVMARQVRHMVEAAAKPNVEIAVLPQSVQIPSGALNIFVVYDERLVVVELFSGEVVLRDPRDVGHHLDLFAFFLAKALAGSATEQTELPWRVRYTWAVAKGQSHPQFTFDRKPTETAAIDSAVALMDASNERRPIHVLRAHVQAPGSDDWRQIDYVP